MAKTNFEVFYYKVLRAKKTRLVGLIIVLYVLLSFTLLLGFESLRDDFMAPLFVSSFLGTACFGMVLTLVGAWKVFLYQSDPLYINVLNFPALRNQLLERADDINSKSIELGFQLGECEEKLETIKSEKGALLIEAYQTPDFRLRLYERWLFSEQGCDASLLGVTADFRDNTSKVSTLDGSVVSSTSTGTFTSQSYALVPGVNAPTSSSGRLDTSSKSVTTHINTLHNAGSATVHVYGKTINAYLTFEDPHFAATVATQINHLALRLKTWNVTKKQEIEFLAASKSELESSVRGLVDEVSLLEKDCPPLTELEMEINLKLEDSGFKVSLQESK